MPIVQPSQEPLIEFHYVKSRFFRVVHVDGAIGGTTPNGFAHVALFNERGAIPTKTTHKITPTGQLGDAVETDSKKGIVRELEIDLMLTPQAAKLLHTWLGGQLKNLERQGLVSAKIQ